MLELKDEKLYAVEKMRFGKPGVAAFGRKPPSKNQDAALSRVAATDAKVDKPAIEWIMDRYQFSKDKDSQIVNDPNDWAREHGDPKYILNFLKSIITVSLETVMVYHLLITRESFIDRDVLAYEARVYRHKLARLKHQARTLGYELVQSSEQQQIAE